MKEIFHVTQESRAYAYPSDSELEQGIPEIGRKDTVSYLRNIHDGYGSVARSSREKETGIRNAPVLEAIESGSLSRHRDHTPAELQGMRELWGNAHEHSRLATAAYDIANKIGDSSKVADGFQEQFDNEPVTPETLEELAKRYNADAEMAKRRQDPSTDRYAAAAELARLLAENFPRVAHEIKEFAELQAYMREGDKAA